MKLVRLARNVILARFAWRYISRRRALARRQRRARRIVAPVVIAGSAGAIWVARHRIFAGARRAVDAFAPQKVAQQATTPSEAAPEQKPDLSEPQKTNPTPSRGDGKAGRHAAARRTTGRGEPLPSPKKRRRRARQQSAAEREKAERESVPPAKVNVESNETPELRAPIGDLKH